MSASGGGTSSTPYPTGATPVAASSGVVANAIATATMPAVAGRTNFVTGVDFEAGSATAAATVAATIAGLLGGTANYAIDVGTSAIPTSGAGTINFVPALPASGVNIAIVASMPALGAGSTVAAVNVRGYLI